jgi:hypothetical protein
MFIKTTSGDVAFLRQKGLILIRPFLLAFICTVIFMFPIVSSFLFRHPMFLKTIGFSLYDANFYVEPFFRNARRTSRRPSIPAWFSVIPAPKR